MRSSRAARALLRQISTTETSPSLRIRTHARPSTCQFCAPARRPLQSRFQSQRRQSTKASPIAEPASQEQRAQEAGHAHQTSSSPTHYDFFPRTLPQGPPPAGNFNIDLSALRKEFLRLQASAHPDMHSEENKRKAQAHSARINEAYKTLQSPLLRAQYLLSLRGVDVGSDETAKVEDTELLMEVLEAREAIEEAENEEELVPLHEENEGRIEESVRALDQAFQKDDLETAKREAVRLRYWVNIRESLDAWEKGKPVVLQH